MRSEGQEQVLNLLRCAWAGSQRYGALVWSGDIHSSFLSLRWAKRFTVREKTAVSRAAHR